MNRGWRITCRSLVLLLGLYHLPIAGTAARPVYRTRFPERSIDPASTGYRIIDHGGSITTEF